MVFTPTDPTKAEVRTTQVDGQLMFDFYIPRGSKGDPGGWVLGTELGTSHLDTILAPGLYKQTNGNNVTTLNGYPFNLSLPAVLKVTNATQGDAASSRLEQELCMLVTPLSRASKVFYKRTLYSGTWGNWEVYRSSRLDTSAGRAVYLWDDISNRDQLVYADTGWRDMSTLLVNGWTLGTGGALQVRRVGYHVYWRAYNLVGTAATSSVFVMVPSGFGYETYSNRLPTTDGTSVTSVLVNNTTGIGANVAVPIAVAYASNFSNWQYPTAQAWPTVLPGTASGSIPNL